MPPERNTSPASDGSIDIEEQTLANIFQFILLVAVGAQLLLCLFQILLGHLLTSLTIMASAIYTAGAVYAVRRGYMRQAGFVLALTLLGIMTAVATFGHGIRDLAVMAFPAILICFGMLLRPPEQLLITILTIAAVAWLSLGDMLQLFQPAPNAPPGLEDFVVIAIILLLTALAVLMLTNNLRHSLAQARHDIIERTQAEAALQRVAEQARQRADRLAMLNETGRAVSTLRDLQSVLIAIYQQAQRNLQLDAFFVGLYDPTHNVLSFPITYDNGRLWDEGEAPMPSGSRIEQVLGSGQPLLINLTPEEVAAPRPPHLLFGDTNKISASLMFAPLQVGETVIGVISAQSYTLNAYNNDDLALLTGIAHQVAIAIENARLYEKVQQRADQLAMLNEVGRAVSTLRNLDGVLEVIYQQVQRILPLDVFMVGLYQPEAHAMAWALLYDSGQRYEDPPTPLGNSSIVSHIIRSGEAVILNRSAKALQIPLDTQVLMGDTKKRSASLMFAPLRVGEHVIGVVSVQSYTPNVYTDDTLALLIGVAYQAAIAIENARLYSAVQQELSERQALIQKLEMQNSELERFTYTVSHDLKSPLVTIGSFLGFLQQDAQSGNLERLAGDIKHIDSAVLRMKRLLDDLLELSRIGRLMNAPERLPFASIVQEALELVRGRLHARGVQVHIHEPLPMIDGDRTRLVEVLQNLIDNAAKFMGDQADPQIDIGMQERDGEWVFFVRDNGIGIDPRYHRKIFGLFEQLEKTDEGTGIGLALVRRIIEVHGGRVWVESQIGQGATFFFTLTGAES